ncbi:MAG: hypothetical protein KDK70_24055, partial [Myxococcales bacterium]|nr:hypothetical protein [Myxococcales bacterium]
LALASYVRGPSKVRAWVDEGVPLPSGVQAFIDDVQAARAVFVALGWPPDLEAPEVSEGPEDSEDLEPAER